MFARSEDCMRRRPRSYVCVVCVCAHIEQDLAGNLVEQGLSSKILLEYSYFDGQDAWCFLHRVVRTRDLYT